MMEWEKSPCLRCTRCDKPEECADKLCPAWQVWYLESWEKTRRLLRSESIGDRMLQEVKRVCKAKRISPTEFACYSSLSHWGKGGAPTAALLARLAEWGGDVAWVLTGKRGAAV